MNAQTKKNHDYLLLSVFAGIAVIFASISTYDISYHFSPSEVTMFGFHFTREAVATMSIFVVDGIYLLLDLRLAKFHTRRSREAAGYFMVALWVVMLSLNIASAVINNSIKSEVLGKFSFVVYAVKVIAMAYLAFYTYVRYDDPNTKRVIIEMESSEARSDGVNYYINLYSKSFASGGAKIIAMEKTAEHIQRETGRHPMDILGKEWRKELAEMAGLSWDLKSGEIDIPADTPTIGKKKIASSVSSELPVASPVLATQGVVDFLKEKVGKILQVSPTGNSNATGNTGTRNFP